MAHNVPWPVPVYTPGAWSSDSNSGFRPPNLPPDEDTTMRKLFVGGLAWETNNETLRRHFERYGEVVEAVVITDRSTAKSKGFGFVTFVDPESATKACQDPTPVINGRMANCNLASLGRRQPTPFYGHMRPIRPNYFGVLPVPRGGSFGDLRYYQPLLYGHGHLQQFIYPPYGYLMSLSDFMKYMQDCYGTFGGQEQGFPDGTYPYHPFK